MKQTKDVNDLSVFRKKALGVPLTEEETKKLKEYAAEWNKNAYKNPKTRARTMLKSARTSASKKNLPFDLTVDWIEQKLIDGLCEVSGISFDFESMNTGKWGHGSQNPFSPSLDRTVPELGYTKDNVKVVVWIYNVGKQNNTHDDITKDLVWKEGYEEGFAAGWKAAQKLVSNYPPVYYGGSGGNIAYTGGPGAYSVSQPGSYAINTMNDTLPSSYTVDNITITGATKTVKTLNDHTLVV